MSDSWKIAHWRFEMISPLLDETLSRQRKRRLIRERTNKNVCWPSSDGDDEVRKPIGRSTLFRWIKDYREKGFEGLLPQTRKDKGLARGDRSIYVDYALGLLYEQPERSLTQLMTYLETEFAEPPMSRSTLSRDLHAHPAYQGIEQRRKGSSKKLRDLYQTDKPHRAWQLDGKGPFPVTFTNGQTQRVHVLSILDSFSRYILAVIIALSESVEAAVRVFRFAAASWGMAEWFQFDRGSAFDSNTFREGIALLGVHRNKVKARSPENQGLIEAYHRSLKRWFVKELPAQEVVDLVHLEALLMATIDIVYNQHWHREIKMSPKDALAGRISPRRVSANDLAWAFRPIIEDKTHPKTGLLSLPTGLFRVPARYAGSKCSFRYDPVEKHVAFLIASDDHRIPLEPYVKKKAMPNERLSEKRGTGQLQKIFDRWQGRERPNAQPGFGLPEVFRELSRLLGHRVPADEREATLIEAFYRRSGPLPREPFREAVDKTLRALGPDRPLKAYLGHIERLIRAAKANNTHTEDQP